MSLSSVLGARRKRNWAGNVSASSWVDEAGVSNAVQATSARQPTAITTLAGNGALSFSSDGSFSTNADVMVAAAAGPSATPQFTFACGVCKVDPGFGNDGNGCVLFQVGDRCLVYIYPGIDNTLRAAGFSNTAFAWGATAINDGLWHTWSAIWDATAGTVRLYIDGVLQAGNSAGTAASIDLSVHDCYLGATNTSGVAVYQGSLSNIALAQDAATFTGDIDAIHGVLAEWIRAVQHGTDGAAATGTTSVSVPYPTGIAAGDLLVLAVANKYPNNGPSTPSGWTLPTNGQGSGGAGTAGADSGSVYTTVFHKIATGSESGSLSVSIPSGNSAIARMLRYTMPAGYAWDAPVAANGADNTAGTAFSVACGSAPGFSAGDVAVCFSGTNTDARTYSAETLTASGATFSGMTERQDSVAATGDQCALVVAEFYVSSGSSNSAPTFTMTASGTTANQNAGSAVVLRLRASATAGGAISGTVPVGVTFSGTLSGAGALAGSVPVAVTPAGTLRGVGSLTGSAPIAISPSGVLVGVGALAGATTFTLSPSGTLSGVGALSGSVPITALLGGTLTGFGALAGSVPLGISPAGILTAFGSIAGSVPIALTFAGTLANATTLSGSVPIALTFSGALTGAGALSGAMPIAITPAGVLRGSGALAGSVPIAVTPSGVLTGPGSLSGSIPMAIAPAGTLKGLGALVGSVPVSVVFAGTLLSAGSGALSGVVPLALTFSGLLTGAGALTGSVPISVAFAGALTGQGALVGLLPIGLSLAGVLDGHGALVGVVPLSVLLQGTLTDSNGAPPVFDTRARTVAVLLTPTSSVVVRIVPAFAIELAGAATAVPTEDS